MYKSLFEIVYCVTKQAENPSGLKAVNFKLTGGLSGCWVAVEWREGVKARWGVFDRRFVELKIAFKETKERSGKICWSVGNLIEIDSSLTWEMKNWVFNLRERIY